MTVVLVVDLSLRAGGTQVRTRILARATGADVRFLVLDGGAPHRGLIADGAAPLTRRLRRWDPRWIRAITAEMRSSGADVLDAHNVAAQFWCSVATRIVKPRRFFVTVHSEYANELADLSRGRAYERVLRLARRSGAEAIAVSDGVASYLKTLGYRDERVHLLPNAVRPPTVTKRVATVREELGLNDDSFAVLVPARLERFKGHEVLVRAVALLRERHTQLVVLFVGEGRQRDALQQQVRDLELSDVVKLLGFRHDVADLMLASDAIVLPSFTEGIPFALLEAAWLARPIIASPVGGIPSIFTAGVDAQLIEPGSPQRLAAAIERFIVEPGFAIRLGNGAKQTATRVGGDDRVLAPTAALYLAPGARGGSKTRRALATVVRGPLGSSSARLLHRVRPVRRELAVLMYHRIADVDEDTTLDPALRSATPSEFARQMRMLADEFDVLSLDRLLEVRGGAPVPDRAVVVTFDYAYRSVVENAVPILRAAGLPSIMFVPTGLVGDRVTPWWDRLYAALRNAPPAVYATPAGVVALDGTSRAVAAANRSISSWLKTIPAGDVDGEVERLTATFGECRHAGSPPSSPLASWEELRSCADAAVELAPHGRRHAIWPSCNDAQLRDELNGARSDLEQHWGRCPTIVAYPAGVSSPSVRRAVAEAGHTVALGTRPGGNDWATDWLDLRRVDVTRRVDHRVLRLLLHPTARRVVKFT